MLIDRIAIFPDTHVPYHDPKALKLAIHVCKEIGISELVIGGDFADFYGVSSHPKDPSLSGVLRDEVAQVIEELSYINRTLRNIKKTYIEGNHENRLSRFIQNKCPEIFGLFDTKGLLELNSMGYDFVPYEPKQGYHIVGTNLLVRHTPLAGGNNYVEASLRRALTSIALNHTHQLKSTEIVGLDGKRYVGISCGFLGDTSHKVMQYVQNHHQWQLGFVLINVYSNWWDFDLVRIHPDYSCRVGTQIFRLPE